MNRKRIMHLLLGLAAVALLAPLANADTVDLTLAAPDVTVLQGTTLVQYFGTIVNPSATDTVYLNSDSSGLSSSDLSLDDTPFALFGPTSLAPGASSGLIELFDLDLPANLTPGTYTGFFSLLGGADCGSFTAFDDIADADFSVTVNAPVSNTPEPRSLIFLAAGLAGLAALSWSKKLV
jgi:hypothetical protein